MRKKIFAHICSTLSREFRDKRSYNITDPGTFIYLGAAAPSSHPKDGLVSNNILQVDELGSQRLPAYKVVLQSLAEEFIGVEERKIFLAVVRGFIYSVQKAWRTLCIFLAYLQN